MFATSVLHGATSTSGPQDVTRTKKRRLAAAPVAVGTSVLLCTEAFPWILPQYARCSVVQWDADSDRLLLKLDPEQVSVLCPDSNPSFPADTAGSQQVWAPAARVCRMIPVMDANLGGARDVFDSPADPASPMMPRMRYPDADAQMSDAEEQFGPVAAAAARGTAVAAHAGAERAGEAAADAALRAQLTEVPVAAR